MSRTQPREDDTWGQTGACIPPAGGAVGHGSGPVQGIWTQTLAEDAQTGAYTGLVRYEPGVDTSALEACLPAYGEEVYLLAGDRRDVRWGWGARFRAGMSACWPPGMVHGPWRTERGVLLRAVRSPGAA